jgi:hypothetical protein
VALGGDADAAGQAVAFTAMLPVADGREPVLRTHLHGLREGGSPFERTPGTHFGRFVVVPDFARDPAQRHDDRLSRPFLLVSACLDGPFDPWLAAFCAQPDVRTALGHCLGGTGDEAALARLLRARRIRTGFFVAAYPQATVARVHEALDLRMRIGSLAVRGQDMTAAELQRAFLEEVA